MKRKEYRLNPLVESLTEEESRWWSDRMVDLYVKIGIAYYNREFDRVVKKFLGAGVPKQKVAKFKDYLASIYPEYREVMDRAIMGEEPPVGSKASLSIVFEPKPRIEVRREDGPRISLLGGPTEWDTEGMKIFFEFLLNEVWIDRVWHGVIKVRRCRLKGCDKIFIPNPKGEKQKYCSQRCRSRAYREHKSRMRKDRHGSNSVPRNSHEIPN